MPTFFSTKYKPKANNSHTESTESMLLKSSREALLQEMAENRMSWVGSIGYSVQLMRALSI